MEIDNSILEIIKIGLAVLAALFTYIMFFYEGKQKKRIEFDIDYNDLGLRNSHRIIEIGTWAENKGYVEHKFESIRLRIRGISKNGELNALKKYQPRLEFPENLVKVFPENGVEVCKWNGDEGCPKELKNAPLTLLDEESKNPLGKVLKVLKPGSFKKKSPEDVKKDRQKDAVIVCSKDSSKIWPG